MATGAAAHTGDTDIDHALIAELRELADGDPAFLGDLYTTFREDGARRLDDLAAALDRADWTALTRAAHGLKGASATIGARGLSERCRALEVDLKTHAGGAPRLGDRVEEIRAELARACAALAPLLCG